MTTSDPQNIRPAVPQLLALAEEMRKDWNPEQTAGALALCANWSFRKQLRQMVGLLCDPMSTPRDLAAAARQPTQWDDGPGDYQAGLAATRAAMRGASPSLVIYDEVAQVTEPARTDKLSVSCNEYDCGNCVWPLCTCTCHEEAPA